MQRLPVSGLHLDKTVNARVEQQNPAQHPSWELAPVKENRAECEQSDDSRRQALQHRRKRYHPEIERPLDGKAPKLDRMGTDPSICDPAVLVERLELANLLNTAARRGAVVGM